MTKKICDLCGNELVGRTGCTTTRTISHTYVEAVPSPDPMACDALAVTFRFKIDLEKSDGFKKIEDLCDECIDKLLIDSINKYKKFGRRKDDRKLLSEKTDDRLADTKKKQGKL